MAPARMSTSVKMEMITSVIDRWVGTIHGIATQGRAANRRRTFTRNTCLQGETIVVCCGVRRCGGGSRWQLKWIWQQWRRGPLELKPTGQYIATRA